MLDSFKKIADISCVQTASNGQTRNERKAYRITFQRAKALCHAPPRVCGVATGQRRFRTQAGGNPSWVFFLPGLRTEVATCAELDACAPISRQQRTRINNTATGSVSSMDRCTGMDRSYDRQGAEKRRVSCVMGLQADRSPLATAAQDAETADTLVRAAYAVRNTPWDRECCVSASVSLNRTAFVSRKTNNKHTNTIWD